MWLNIIMHDQKDHSQYVEHDLNKKVQSGQICEGKGLKYFISKKKFKDIFL